MGETRRMLKSLRKEWDKDEFLTYLEIEGVGVEGIAKRLATAIKQNADTRGSLKAIGMALEVSGILKEQGTKSEMNVFINQINNMTYDEISGMVMMGLKAAEKRVIEGKNGDYSGDT